MLPDAEISTMSVGLNDSTKFKGVRVGKTKQKMRWCETILKLWLPAAWIEFKNDKKKFENEKYSEKKNSKSKATKGIKGNEQPKKKIVYSDNNCHYEFHVNPLLFPNETN